MQIDDDAISDAKKYFFKSDGHQTRIYYPLTHCQYGIYVQSYIMYLFVCIADFHRLSSTRIQLFIETYKLFDIVFGINRIMSNTISYKYILHSTTAYYNPAKYVFNASTYFIMALRPVSVILQMVRGFTPEPSVVFDI